MSMFELLDTQVKSLKDSRTFTLFSFIMAGRLLLVVVMYSFSKMKAQALLPPKLTVSPQMITETDSVTLNCQTPSSLSVRQCYFHIVRGRPAKSFSCLQTLTGTELLKMAHLSSPAEVEVTCFYLSISPSPKSNMSSIIVRSLKPQMSLQHFHGDYVHFTCSLPVSANPDTRCNLYFGEASRPVLTTTIWRKTSTKTKQWFCQFTVTIDDLLRRLHLVQQSDASCDYSLGSEPTSLSPRSDGYSLTDIVETESWKTQTMPTFIMTTGLTVSRPHASTPVTSAKRLPGLTVGTPSSTGRFISTVLTSVKPASGLTVSRPRASSLVTPVKLTSGWTGGTPSNTGGSTSTSRTPVKPASAKAWTWKFVIVVAGCGVTVGVILLVSAILCNKGRAAGSEELKSREPQNENSETYHLYSTISEEPAASALKDIMYSTVQIH